ncbi:aminoglycoside phosphotransferase family protein [Nocardia sp. CA2R105]|uniref:aminoglycoside phosphotransferase family protein n=1 Tax=Nocardia coffeae TaxID=2873381 RepID=UPI001CA65590|nr:aminoglycoside phosphotransferase family protein [Nocardia coffeae]MBY8858647.1 aminoglycoside phosphotransferase family protein [Nocardia coffeae]
MTARTIADGAATPCCVYCVSEGQVPVVLKIPADPAAGRVEADLPRWWTHTGATPIVLHTDPDFGVFVTTQPGTMLAGTPAAADATAFSQLLTQLHQPSPDPLPPLVDLAHVMEMRVGWARELATDPRYTAPDRQPAAIAALDDTCSVLEVLLRSTPARHVVHADLHPGNILEGGGTWCAINPFGAIGDLHSDAALWAVCQIGPSRVPSVAALMDQLDMHPLLSLNRLRAWAWVTSILEHRPHQQPQLAARMRTFTADYTPLRPSTQYSHETETCFCATDIALDERRRIRNDHKPSTRHFTTCPVPR